MKDWQYFLFYVVGGLALIVIIGLFFMACIGSCGYPTVYDFFPKPTLSIEYIMNQNLKKVTTAGYGITDPKEAALKINSVIDKQKVIGAVALQSDELCFKCVGSLCSKAFGALTCVTNQITLKAENTAYFVVCGDESRKQNPKYCIGLGEASSNATEACVSACGLK